MLLVSLTTVAPLTRALSRLAAERDTLARQLLEASAEAAAAARKAGMFQAEAAALRTRLAATEAEDAEELKRLWGIIRAGGLAVPARGGG